MKILAWHSDAAWMRSFVQGPHEYLVPVLKERGPFGRGLPGTEWPASALELPPRELAQLEVDVVVLQRPQELGLAAAWLGRKPGIDIPAVYVEHEAPRAGPDEVRHPLADHPELTLVHVTHFNRLFWNCGSTPTRVIEPGIADPGYRYRGELAHAAAETPRSRETGADLLERFGALAPVDLFASACDARDELAQRRLYLHLSRWSSLDRSLLEAMQLGMPVVALATAEVPLAVPPAAGIVSNCIETLEDGIRQLLDDPGRARRMGRAARRAARERYGIERFLRDWDALLEQIARPMTRAIAAEGCARP